MHSLHFYHLQTWMSTCVTVVSFCYCDFLSQQLCTVEKPVSVSIHHVDNFTPMEEGKEIQLRCDIVNIAPEQKPTVLWYKNQGEELFL